MDDEFLMNQWKEINEHTRHWEKLVFENVRSFFNIIGLALAAAGAVLAWPGISPFSRKFAITTFLLAAVLLSVSAILIITSNLKFLGGFYSRRRELEKVHVNLKLRPDNLGSNTLKLIRRAFIVPMVISLILMIVLILEPTRPLLEGAKLGGADLSGVRNLTDRDLSGACGDSTTKLPANLNVKLPTCVEVSPSPKK